MQHEPQRKRVRHWIDFYRGHTRMLRKDLERAKLFLWQIVQAIHERGLPMELALLPEVESGYNPMAICDGSRATGLWQMMAATAKRFHLRRDWWYDGRRDIVRSTHAALDYLQYLNEMFHGNWTLTMAAYNAGGGAVQRAMEHNAQRGRPTDFWHLNLPKQTERYVPKVLALAALIEKPAVYGIRLPSMPNAPQLKTVKLLGPISLKKAASLSGISTHALRDLNPGFRRSATAPHGADRLLLPRTKVKRFKRELASLPAHMAGRRHVVRRGDTLGAIARHYGTTPAAIKRANHLHGNLIRVGQSLLIPEAAKKSAARREAHTTGHATNGDSRRATAYSVKSGDSLSRIAKRLGVTVAQLRQWNHLPKGYTLHPGEELKVRTAADP